MHQHQISQPISVDEVVDCLRKRWLVSYQLRLFRRGGFIYLQMMWGYLEQKSFPLTEEEYMNSLAHIIEIINRGGLAYQVRNWLNHEKSKPRVGRAITLQMVIDEKMKEFLL